MATVLGTRGYYVYTSDTGKTYNMYGRDLDMAAAGNTGAARGANPDLPRRFKCRGVWAKATDGSRRFFKIGDIGNTKYTAGGTITADEAMNIEGRVGEKDLGSVTD